MGMYPCDSPCPTPSRALSDWPCKSSCGFALMGIREVLHHIVQPGKSGLVQVTHWCEVTLVPAEPKHPEQMPS